MFSWREYSKHGLTSSLQVKEIIINVMIYVKPSYLS